MRKIIIYLLMCALLFQSCYSYKTLDLKIDTSLQQEQVKIILNNTNKIKGVVLESSEENISVQQKDKTINVSLTNIKKIKKRKFSWSKTTLASMGYVYGLYILLVITLVKSI